ncbi:HEAT repeat domain-containing protein [Tautonia sociabilis]|uniref:HEAT repeat domain-containing protein n=1 Tax=Tautonia sociabilis TaxID=2080755 RepID=A0A432MQ48_9BACT|nr:HEAT repeat domain-containing protein [Tautonia sociabilis]RUL89196.1 HEAT repeat domain-containing protein [Tautonia sociabilis]
MTGGIACSIALAAHLAVGGLGLFDCLKAKHRPDRREHSYGGPECCGPCRSEAREVERLILLMQRHPNWKERDDAAHDLRDFDWRDHPELAPALAASMLVDPHEEVREEAAESLAKLAPRDGSAHLALRQAALTDPDHATRKWARRALDRLDRRCLTDCALCGPPLGDAPEVVIDPVPWGLDPIEATGERGVPIGPPIDRVLPNGTALPPGAFGGMPVDPSPTLPPHGLSPAPRTTTPSPGALPHLPPPALPPAEGPIEVLPPELPPPAPPSSSPFGASGRRVRTGPTAPGRAGPVRILALGPP